MKKPTSHHVFQKTSLGLVAFAVAVFLPHDIRAQARLTGADLDGSVRDESGAVIPGATMTVTSVDTNVTRSALTDAQGHFIVPALAPGTYRVSAEMAGFTRATRDDSELQLGQAVEVNFSLKVARTEETVTVRADVPMVNVHDSSVSQVVGVRQIENLPINGRDFISFTVITPGVTQDNTPGVGSAATSGLSFAGQRARSNNIMVDGLDNNDVTTGAVRALFSQEAIREFQVLTNSYSAEFGKASGGVVNIVTKSGTNDLHGNLFGYLRDRRLNAKDYFEEHDVFANAIERDKSPFKQAQYGGTLGGPIKKEKTFFFVSFERLDQTANNLVTISDAAAAVFNGLGFPVATGPNRYDVKQTELFGKMDYQWSADSSLVVRANFADRTNENVEPFGGLIARSRGAVLLATDSSVSASHNRVLSSKWVNEARVQYARQDQTVDSLDPNCGGPCLANDQGGPTLEVAGVASVGRQRFTPQVHLPDRIQLMDTVSHFTGRHQIKSGVDYNWIHNQYTLPLQLGGRYIFPSLTALVAGTPAAYIQGYGNDAAPFAYQDLSLFVYTAGSQFLVSYTLSKAEDNSTDFLNAFVPQSMGLGRNPADPRGLPRGFDPDNDRGPAAWDQRHRFVVSGLYQLPAGLQISAIATLASGRPFSALAGADLNGDGNGGASPTDRARTNPADVATSVGRNSERLPGQATVDFRVSWRHRAGTGKPVVVEPLVEAFNLLNRTNYSDVSNVFGAGAFPNNPARDAQGRVTYGTFTQAYSPRQIQFAVKMSF